ncbi:MAG: hypothetical protein HC771_14295 [Synechococcales cyanobacterium CRU_2_2]|nr:hypothetical protein [Synechococcales cyanobacterium CRU_2_2]
MGGAVGLSLDGQYTDGTLSFLLFPSPETTWLEMTMFSERITPEYKCTFTVFLRGFE